MIGFLVPVTQPVQEMSYFAAPGAYAKAKFSFIMDSNISPDVRDSAHGFNLSLQPYPFIKTAFMGRVDHEHFVPNTLEVSLATGKPHWRKGNFIQALLLLSESQQANELLVGQLEFPLKLARFKNYQGSWISEVSNNFGTIKTVLVGEETVKGQDCLRFSQVFRFDQNPVGFESRETVWLRKSDCTTQRYEWDIRQTGNNIRLIIRKLKLTIWRTD